jgi:hypothetical protein
MLQQSAREVLMVAPVQFAFNLQTAESNSFQNENTKWTTEQINEQAQNEFKNFVALLESHQIKVTKFIDTVSPATPDSIFPNNWISKDQHGRVIVYPMCAENRRLEKREDIINYLLQKEANSTLIDYSNYEAQNIFLEGTGSMVIDYVHNIAYACLSPRTNKELFIHFCNDCNYTPCYFTSVNEAGKEIYHTNVMMCIGTGYAIVCLDSIPDIEEKEKLLQSFTKSGHQIIAISFEQMNAFAGNMLEVQNATGQRFLVMSKKAFGALTEAQINLIKSKVEIINADINTIETIGGGGVRCMLAEVF